MERTVSYFEVTGSKQASTVMGSESTVMGSESTVMGSESTVMGSDTAVTGSGTVPVPGKPQDACCPSRGLQSDLMVGVACVKGSATPARLGASSCRSLSRYAARAHGTPRACSASQTSSYRTSAAAEATVSASSHPQPSFVAALVARALASATMSAVLSRPFRARGPACVASDYAPACAPLTHCFTIRARAHTCEHAHTAHAGTLCWAAANILRTTSFHGCERV